MHEAFQYTKYSQLARRLTCVVPIPPGESTHTGLHTHGMENDVFHFCDTRCPNCEYFCTLPLRHTQQLHETSHGSMTATKWVVEGSDSNPVYELQGRKFGSGDEGAPMLCSLVCAAQGRHAHVDYCRDPDNCDEPECEHIDERMHPEPGRPKDWVSHGLSWARTGFKDPYSQEEQLEFSKCDVLCAGISPSLGIPRPALMITFQGRNTKPPPQFLRIHRTAYFLFFMHLKPGDLIRLLAMSHWTGIYSIARIQLGFTRPTTCEDACTDIQLDLTEYHCYSISMTRKDRRPLPNTPISARLATVCNNRYGAVLSALYGFWLSRDSATTSSSTHARQDAYSVITFDRSATTRVANDFISTTDQLINQLIPQISAGGTSFRRALSRAQSLIETHWSSDRAPVVVFLSDGECEISDNRIYDLCGTCARLGKPLAFYSVSFGSDAYSASLRQMVDIAREIYASAPQDVINAARGNPCAYTNAIDSVMFFYSPEIQVTRTDNLDPTGRHVFRYCQLIAEA
ncbi:hypothetical protein FRC12_008165 [Ceratobasidium sp. 428]|nr:hypothetical protein FRC12_008165 [Ceratobasidium sp. 428]